MDKVRDRLAVFLGAGRPSRGTIPSALQVVTPNKQALGWLLACFSSDEWMRNIVLGYQADQIASQYPDILSSFNAMWESTGPVRSLFSSPFASAQEAFVSYTDILYDRDTVNLALNVQGDIVVFADSLAAERYEQRTAADLDRAEWLHVSGEKVTTGHAGSKMEFVGLALFRKTGIEAAARLWDKGAEYWERQQMVAFLTALASVVDVRAVDLKGGWAEQNAPQDVAHYVLGTKAHTLARLSGMVKKSVVPEHYTITVAEWRENNLETIQALQTFFGKKLVAVRSSCKLEDTWQSANAGKFESLLNIPASDATALSSAVEKVFTSYGEEKGSDEVLIQSMAQDVAMAGVVFTRSLERGAPYFVINYDTSGKTDTITAGTTGMAEANSTQTVVIRKTGSSFFQNTQKTCLPSAIPNLVAALEEISHLAGHDALDIEFAINKTGVVFILQVRPIAVDHTKWRVEDQSVHVEVESAKETFKLENSLQRPGMAGSSTVFSVMSDWNPAEIIGVTPNRLAFSLYRHIITDEIWARQRAEFGYRDIRPAPLIRLLGGHPYVDVRASFSSFIPAWLPDPLANRLVDHYLGELKKKPYLHDKVELEIVATCLSFDWPQHAASLANAHFDQTEINALHDALSQITNNAPKRLEQEQLTIGLLEASFEKITAAKLPPLAEACWLLSEVHKGTLCFSHMARIGFIAVILLQSAARAGIIAQERHEAFMRSLHTVSKEMRADAWLVKDNEMTFDIFIQKYGHLRPGTYEISVPCYFSEPEKYLAPAVRDATPCDASTFSWSAAETKALSAALKKLGLSGTWDQWELFCRAGIEGREFSKFIFSRLLSKAIEGIAEWGALHGFSRSELSHVSVTDILSAQQGQFGANTKCWLQKRIHEGEEFSLHAACIELPPFIAAETDFDIFYLPDNRPNFIGSDMVVAQAATLPSNITPEVLLSLHQAIVLIPQADPGYDWLFGHNLKGLITCYGGANSHMAIRAAELGLAAAIGVGEKLYAQLGKASIIRLDPAGRRVERES